MRVYLTGAVDVSAEVRCLDAWLDAHRAGVRVLSLNLYELVKRNRFRGVSLSLLRVLVSQVLSALAVLGAHGVVEGRQE